MQKGREELLRCFSGELLSALRRENLDDAEEIRLIAGRPMSITRGGIVQATEVCVTAQMVQQTLETVCRHSIYAMQPSLAQGYITLRGGHRVGVCGKTTVRDGKVTSLLEISALCFRIAREVIGAADGIMRYLCAASGIRNTLIISPPACGKTTLLRDAARQLGNRYRVCIVDERSELAAMSGGVAQCDVGCFTTVLDACPKSEGILMALRAMSPQVIITDEIGGAADEEAIYTMMNCGVKIVCTAHGYDAQSLLRRGAVGQLLRDGVFETLIIMENKAVRKVVNGRDALL